MQNAEFKMQTRSVTDNGVKVVTASSALMPPGSVCILDF